MHSALRGPFRQSPASVVLTLLIALTSIPYLTAQPASARKSPPSAPVRIVTDTYFDTNISDPYRYMEDLGNPEVTNWIKAQAEYTESTLASIPARPQLFKRIKQLDESEPERVRNLQVVPGELYFYEKRLATEDVSRLYMRKSLTGAETLLVNPAATQDSGNPHLVLSYYFPSQDGRYVAYGISPGGSEEAVLHVIDTGTGRETGEGIDRAMFGQVSFLSDGKSFTYNRLRKLGPNAAPTDKYLNSVTFLHLLGAPSDGDKPVFGNGVAGVSMAASDIPFVVIAPESKYVFGVVAHGVQNELTIYYALEAALAKADLGWKKLCDVADDVTNLTVRGDDVYLLSHHGASRFKVLRVSMKDPDIAKSETLVPASEDVLQNFNASADALYVQKLHDGIGRLVRVPYGTKKTEEVKLPFDGSVSLFSSDPRVPGVYFLANAWIKGARVMEFTPEGRTVRDTKLQRPGEFDSPKDLVSVEVKAKSHDGVMIPLSIVYRKDTKLDGSNPLLLEAYGAYGITSDPRFDPKLLALYERGGVHAVAHVRGGGEYGEDWHNAGRKLTKPNTWKDMIACAQYLIDNKYTSSKRLAILGGSAGGITVGRSITERPDLFAVAIDAVPMSDVVRAEFTPNGPPNIPEFGTVKEQDGFKALYEMSAYHHVEDGKPYPAVMLTSGINDPRVIAWQPAKLAARLQAATSSKKPVLFRVDFDAGHGIGSTKTQKQREWSDILTFILWQVGVPEFQPAEAKTTASAN